MHAIQHLRQYPMPLWALACYLLSLGFNFPVDAPLAIFLAIGIYSLLIRFQWDNWQRVLVSHWPVILFLISSLVSTLFSVNISHSLRVQPQLLSALVIYAVISCYVTDNQRFDFIVAVLLLSAGLIALSVLIPGVRKGDAYSLVNLYATNSPIITVPNDLLLLSMLVPFALMFLRLDGGTGWQRGCAVTFLLLAFVCIIFFQSRIALTVYCLACMFFIKWNRPFRVFGLLSGLLISGLLLDHVFFEGRMASKIFMFPRFYVWKTAWTMFLDDMLVGKGPGMFRELYFHYLGEAGYVLEKLGDRREMPWAHNLFLELMAERGIIGLTSFSMLIVHPVKRLLQKLGKLPMDACRAKREFAILIVFLTLFVGGLVEISLLRLWVITFLFIFIALASALENIDIE